MIRLLPVVASLASLATVAVLARPLDAQQSPAHTFGWVLEAAFEGGGARVAETYFTDGSSQTMRAGQGGTFAVGMEFRPRALPRLGLRGTVGWKFVTTAATNADIKLTRFPLEAAASWALDKDWHVDAGIVHHTGIRYDGGGFGPNAEFDPATGATLELGWRWVALTYTAMDYTDEFGYTYDASGYGVSFRWVVGKR
jgi:hypothetical protein